MKIAATVGIVLFAASVVSIAVIAHQRAYYVRDDGGATLLWHADEAYLFVSTVDRGFQTSYLDLPIVYIKEYFGAPSQPDDERSSLWVIRVTPSGIERRIVPEQEKICGFLTPFDGQIFANCGCGALCKWTGANFGPASPQEQRGFDGINHLSAGIDTEINGWSKRFVGPTLSADLGKGITISVKREGDTTDPRNNVSVDLLRPGQAAERLWYIDRHPRNVSKSDYEKMFQKPRESGNPGTAGHSP